VYLFEVFFDDSLDIFLMLIIVECVAMRKMYYRMLLMSQFLKDEIALSSLPPQSTTEDLELESIAKELEVSKKKKKRIKLLLRRVEKWFFLGFCILLLRSLKIIH
jgi:hypothetical protein